MVSYITIKEWSERFMKDGIEVRPPQCGNRIVVKLFWDVAPLACENFATLCTNGNSSMQQDVSNSNKKVKPPPVGQSGKPLSYKNTAIHRVVKGFIMQGGDFVFGNGSGGESIFNGKKFKDERGGLLLKHDRKGIISMGNSGKNSNSSQFFITFKDTPQCDGKHVIFGEVISGFEVIDAVEKVGSSGDGEPIVPVQITDCGAFYPSQTSAAGYWFDQPDVDSFSGFSSIFMTRPRVAVVTPTISVYEKFIKFIGDQMSCIPISLDSNDLSENGILDEVTKKLESFSIDIVLVAPVYGDRFKTFDIPESWCKTFVNKQPECHEVILVCKPVDAMIAIKETAWVSKMDTWQLDGGN